MIFAEYDLYHTRFSMSLATVDMCNGGRGRVQSSHVFVLIRRAAYFGRLRKTLFTLHLWRPAHRRPRPRTTVPDRTPEAAVCDAGIFKIRSADRGGSLEIGWLNVQSLRNKTDVINAAITERSLDVLALTETWHTASDDTCLRLATPPGYATVDAARTSRRGGGVAVIFRQQWKAATLPLPVCSTFEVIAVRLTTKTGQFIVVDLYRPGSERLSTQFFDDLSAVLETLVVYSCPVLVGGDFNIPAQLVDDPGVRHLSDLLTSFDMVQHVRGATHRAGNTLDLIVTSSQCQLGNIDVEPPGRFSDHSLVVCQLPCATKPASFC